MELKVNNKHTAILDNVQCPGSFRKQNFNHWKFPSPEICRHGSAIETLTMEQNCMGIYKHHRNRSDFLHVLKESWQWTVPKINHVYFNTLLPETLRLCLQAQRLTSPHLNCHSSAYITVAILSLTLFTLKQLLIKQFSYLHSLCHSL